MRKLADFYTSCMDEAATGAAGVSPLQGELDRIAAIRDRASLQEEIACLQERGINALFQFDSENDRKNPRSLRPQLQGGLGLPDRDCYMKTDNESKILRQKYVAHVARMLELMADDAFATSPCPPCLASGLRLSRPARSSGVLKLRWDQAFGEPQDFSARRADRFWRDA